MWLKHYFNSLGVIDYPDLAGMASNYTDAEVVLTAGSNSIGICNMFHSCPTSTSVSSVAGSQSGLTVFPNPAGAELNVRVPQCNGAEQIKITDVTGE